VNGAGSLTALLGDPSTSPVEATNLAFRPILSRPSIRALALGAVCFIALEAAANWLVPGMRPSFAGLLLPLTLILPGLVLGLVAKRSPLMHGLLFGPMARSASQFRHLSEAWSDTLRMARPGTV
jgi:hypothetical protein